MNEELIAEMSVGNLIDNNNKIIIMILLQYIHEVALHLHTIQSYYIYLIITYNYVKTTMYTI